MKKITFLLVLKFLIFTSYASECIIDVRSNHGTFYKDQIELIKNMCNPFALNFIERYGVPPAIELTSMGEDIVNASFDPNLYREPLISFEAGVSKLSPHEIGIILCHELGHGIANKGPTYKLTKFDLKKFHGKNIPKEEIDLIIKSPGTFKEREADYFAATCMKTLFQENIIDLNDALSPSLDIQMACKTKECEAILQAAKNVLVTKEKDLGKDFFKKPTRSLRLNFFDDHPSLSCRLKIMLSSLNNEEMINCW